jgi:hypothetical protein
MIYVNIKYSGEQNQIDSLNFRESDIENHCLPVSFKFNGSWSLSHVCFRCGSIVSFGQIMEEKALKMNCPVLYLSDKYFEKPQLSELSKIIEKSELMKIYGKYSVVKKKYKELSMPPVIQLAYYGCNNCKTKYLADITIGYSNGGEKGEIIESHVAHVESIVNISMSIESILIQ